MSFNNNPSMDSSESRADADHTNNACRDTSMEVKTDSRSFLEYDLINNMTSFLEANAAENIDKKVLRNMAVALAKQLNDTSPGTLQDVTMENPYGIGYRSPCVSLQPYQGSTSPAAQGRSVREFEEQMASLRKECFNLKLRLYFTEESIPGYTQASNSTEGQDTLMKQLIDSKVEMEILRKEIQEKQDVLKDAAAAMTQMEKIQKDTEAKCEQMVDDLRQKIQFMEMERNMERSQSNGDLMNDLLGRSEIPDNLNALQRIHELEGLLKQADEKLEHFKQKISSLDHVLAQRDDTIKEYEDKVKELVFQNAELIESIETKERESSNNEAQQLREELQKVKSDMADKSCMMLDLEDKLKNCEQLYDKARRTIQKLMLNIKKQQEENSQLKNNTTQASNVSKQNDKESTNPTGISGLECTGFCRSFSDTEALNDLTSLQKQKYDSLIEQQEKTIQTLNAELKKKTADLQNFVNKELWEKNREIERLNKILSATTNLSPVSASQTNTSQAEVQHGELQHSFSDVEYNKAIQRNKLLQRKVDILIQRVGTERQNDAVITQLRTELQQARLDAETAEKWRRQCADLCTVLSTRLEELAGFLNSLLKHKDVLGVLAIEKRKAMRRAVDRSLDLSKSLNMTLSVSGLSMIDQSLAELHNLSDILGDVDFGLDKTFNSHEELHGQQQSIENLKAENKALKKELDKRRTLESKKERRSLPLPMMAENRESESEAWSEPDRKVSLARIGLEDHSASLMVKEQQPSISQHNETDSDYSESNSRSFKARSQERIQHLEHLIQQRDNRILEIQCQLVDADNHLKKENLKVLEVTQELKHLRQRNEELHNDLINIGSQEPTNNHNESLLLKQINEKSRSLEKIQEERERLMVESRLAEMQINSMKADMEIVKQTYEEALQQAAEREKQQLSAVKQEMEELLEKTLKVKEQEYQESLESLERDYIAINLYEECKQKLLVLQIQYVEAQRSIDCLQENEHELKQTLVETELTSRNLQKQIDDSTLRASKATMERVKALNDKLQLEKRVEELTLELSKNQDVREHMQQQIIHLEDEHKLLQKRLTSLQAKQTRSNDIACQSGYTSEEVPMTSSNTGTTAANIMAQKLLGEQRVQNSSPDLGIESDAGRVSSVELNSVQCPLLKTVEMSPSSNNSNESDEGLINSSTENIKPSNVPSDATAAAAGLLNKKHDCLKVEQENAELRRKLLRTKRAFEDTYEKLRNANQRKAQIEKDIKNQILKTHNVLKNVRSNMENEL